MSKGRVGQALRVAAAMACAILLAPTAFADSNARIVRLSFVDGNVQLDRAGGMGYENAFLNQPVIQGTRVWTREDGRAEIEFEGGTTVRMAPDTYVNVLELGMRGSGDRYSMVEVQEGTAYINFERRHNDEFRVTVSGREIHFTNSGRIRLTVDRTSARIAILKGSVEVPAEGRTLDGHKGETLTLDLTDPAHYGLAREMDREDFDDWDQERQDYDSRYSNGGYSGYNTAYSYGVSDLNYWGGYSNIPGYGQMWQPYGIGPNWDPFLDGAWVWYPGYGYMWVSAYPWGWMPYRYGTWFFIGGRGWCWRPATYWNTWHAVTVVQNPPLAYHQPAPPVAVVPPRGGPAPKTVIVGGGPVTVVPRVGPHGTPLPGGQPIFRPVTAGGSGGAGATTPAGTARPGTGTGTAGTIQRPGTGTGTAGTNPRPGTLFEPSPTTPLPGATTRTSTGAVTSSSAPVNPRGHLEEVGTPDKGTGGPHTIEPVTTPRPVVNEGPADTAQHGGSAATSSAPAQHTQAPVTHPAPPPHVNAPPPSPHMFSSSAGTTHMSSGTTHMSAPSHSSSSSSGHHH